MERRGLEPTKQVAYFEYDFAIDGGAVGTITLRGDRLPIGAVVTSGMKHVLTAVTSGGACTTTLGFETATDILGSTLKGAQTLNALLDIVPAGTAATAVRITSTSNGAMTMTIGVAAITAGKFVVAVEYL
jgi:hypothetical protein